MKKLLLIIFLFLILITIVVYVVKYFNNKKKYEKLGEATSIGIIGGSVDPDETYNLEDISEENWNEFLDNGLFGIENSRIKSLLKKEYKNAATASWILNYENRENDDEKPSLVKAVVTSKKFDGHNIILDVDFYSSYIKLKEGKITLGICNTDGEDIFETEIDIEPNKPNIFLKAIKNINDISKHGEFIIYIKNARVNSIQGEVIGLYPNSYLKIDR